MTLTAEEFIANHNVDEKLAKDLTTLEEIFGNNGLTLTEFHQDGSTDEPLKHITVRAVTPTGRAPVFVLLDSEASKAFIGFEANVFKQNLSFVEEGFSVLFAHGLAFCTKQLIQSLEPSKKEIYSSARFINTKKYIGMHHDTLLDALNEFYRVKNEIQANNEVGFRIENRLNREEGILIEYAPSTDTMIVEGMTITGEKALIRSLMLEKDQYMAITFG